MRYTQELHDRIRQNLRMFDYPRFDDGDIEALLDEIDRLTVEVEKHRWIPVSERLPEERSSDTGKEYIVYNTFFDIPHTAWWNGEDWYSDFKGTHKHSKQFITHWMSLKSIPEPPKEGATC